MDQTNGLRNKQVGCWGSCFDNWKFKDEEESHSVYIENSSKNKVLGSAKDGKVILEIKDEDKDEQLWSKGGTDDEGYFSLINAKLPNGWVTDTKLVTAKLMTAISSMI